MINYKHDWIEGRFACAADGAGGWRITKLVTEFIFQNRESGNQENQEMKKNHESGNQKIRNQWQFGGRR
jgi:hypothetical protein